MPLDPDAVGMTGGGESLSGFGYWLASGLGIAGGILGFPIAIAAGIVGLAIGASAGNTVGKKIDDSNTTCPKCNKGLVL